MKKAYKILVPTDFSETADYALEIGSVLAQRNESTTHILHVKNILKHWADLAEESKGNLYKDIRENIAEAKAKLDARVEAVQKSGVSSAESFLEFDKGYKGILGHAEDHQSDLIVMGAHGLTGLKGMLIGSFTQKVLHHTQTPVLAIKKVEKENDLKHIVYVSDYDPDYTDTMIKLVEMANQFNLKVSFLCINTRINFRETEETDRNMNAYLSKVPDDLIGSVEVINALMFDEALGKYCDRHDVDMIGVPAYTKSHSWGALGMTIEGIINQLGLPVLAIPIT